MNQGSDQRQTHSGTGVNTFPRIQMLQSSCSYNFCLALAATTMDLVFNANNLVPDFVTLSLLLSSAIEILPSLEEWVFLAASADHYSQMQLVSGRKDCCCCGKPSSEGAEVSPSAVQELLGVSGCWHWSSCDTACLCGGVAGFV